MTKFRKVLVRFLLTLGIVYVVTCTYLYFAQESIIFFPEKLDKNFQFRYAQNFEELNIKTADGTLLNGLLFRADSSQGLIFYLHGNAGSLSTWGDVAQTYLALSYDVFILDYRGYGKSDGEIDDEDIFLADVQSAYNEMKKRYSENRIVVLGYSIGTGPAAKIASVNRPRLLILQAPYFSLPDMMTHEYPMVPAFLLKYHFETNEYIKTCTMPIVIFHGDKDEVIYYESSVKLKEFCKSGDTLITLHGQGHNGITANQLYKNNLQRILK